MSLDKTKFESMQKDIQNELKKLKEEEVSNSFAKIYNQKIAARKSFFKT